ncbi:MAG: hypothetical protein A3J10_01710 [Candidatus Sungbacteria bacterium RIFCSPLOWO2_02_FULL_54_10]|uniref:DUF5615 domain-containing protein n=2 Tax=Candidatus Sungiibacteriota TaxID=1817917 RepID=A0A1G2L8T1_9BACT|nr:MAG: hypothetical protein A2679_00275 [Candidatus Sungbacteria bacterium RIFCSPHIGHO2_01_FULL_54_26]OHA03364.1 MAG: hypothetical protein A3C92_00275 [Candidatus Sungbacteria bacterium RIFCSPHIGHO2_02_FULL_53_17]OHA07212.1 MAG: hypothetical protein A3B34_00190 [Candidatus Sungbacteria bacterium RIFCSPLOWO2_01_FULL_54_21]OHA12500.1 MAG: hypothetical protein A3J10_01710 [Candidatus Sungbacteria bacterium RIFCSPLOWO2_02_FULL_54_10]
MKIVIDEDIHRSLAEVLRSLGHQTTDVRDIGLRGKPDEDIFRFAQEQGAVLLSGDLGFANVVHFPLGSHHGIIILRFPNEMPSSALNVIVGTLMSGIPDHEFVSNLSVLSPRGLRMRRSKK